jgi:CRP-like cAMP-binding protein
MSSPLTTPQLPAQGILEPLGDEDRDILSGYGEFLPVQPGQHLIEEGMQQSSLFFVVSGKFHATAMRGGHKVLLGPVQKGETLGEINLSQRSNFLKSGALMARALKLTSTSILVRRLGC